MDDFLLELFREEVSAHAAALTEGFLGLERQGSSAQTIEPLMRAAHSIKGAARVVDLLPVVHIAHAMEDVLVAAGAGHMQLDAPAVDAMLGALDWIVNLAVKDGAAMQPWLEQHAGEAEDWVRRVEQLMHQPAAPAAVETAFDSTASSSALPATDAAAAPANELGETPPEAVQPASASDAPALPPPLAAPSDGGSARHVKVATDVFDQLMAFAAESLVETHRQEALLAGVLQLRKLQRRLAAAAGEPDTLNALLRELNQALEAHSGELHDVVGRNAFLSERLYRTVLGGRMRPFYDGVQGFPRLVRDLARQLGKQASLEIQGRKTLVDRDILEKLDAPLNHLLRNALDHGLESPEQRLSAGKPAEGRLRLSAHHRAGRLLVTVSDDGRGIDPERLRETVVQRGLAGADMVANLSAGELYDFLFLPGFSTREEVSEISGRGVGLDVVQTMVHACGGSLRVSSQPGAGTQFHLQLPVTRSVLRALRVSIAGDSYALPMARIERVLRLAAGELRQLEGRYYYFAEAYGNVALLSARTVLALEPAPATAKPLGLVLIGSAGHYHALEVDALLGECNLVVRQLDSRLGKVPYLNAVAVDEQGEPVLILDVDDLLHAADAVADGDTRRLAADTEAEAPGVQRVLVVDDSLTVREMQRKLLGNHGYQVDVAVDGVEGWNALQLHHYDLIVSDVDMPRLNGIELVRRIKSDERLMSLPVIIVSYKDRPEDRLRGMEAGADYYLTKSSFHDTSLIQAVRDLIGGVDE